MVPKMDQVITFLPYKMTTVSNFLALP